MYTSPENGHHKICPLEGGCVRFHAKLPFVTVFFHNIFPMVFLHENSVEDVHGYKNESLLSKTYEAVLRIEIP